MIALRIARSLRRPVHRSRALHISPTLLAGHNKWSKIEKRKGANDIKKGLLYSRTYKEIAIAVRSGGNADPEQNNALAAVLKRAKKEGVPKENIENALKKVSGENGKGDSHLVFEVIGPGSVGLIVESLSDNPNRTIKFLTTLLKDHGARLADVKFLFRREGRVKVALEPGDDLEARLEKVVEVALDADAEDFETEDLPDGTRTVEFKCPHTSLHKLTSALTAPGVCRELISSELVYAPLEPLEELDEESAEGLGRLVEAIEDLDDTLRVWTTADS
ncbi:YebC-like protein [Pilatotrama ljubarskyi]|nr:YebC-like protein [Pilatotrama ljubarskyi]